MKLCPCQEDCVHYDSGDNKPKNHDVRNKYVCMKYVKMCKLAFFYESEIMGIVSACPIKRGV